MYDQGNCREGRGYFWQIIGNSIMCPNYISVISLEMAIFYHCIILIIVNLFPMLLIMVNVIRSITMGGTLFWRKS